MTVRTEPSKAEKAWMILLMTVLMAAEIRNLYVEDAEQAKKFNETAQQLDATKKGLDTTITGINGASQALQVMIANSQTQFNATMGNMNRLWYEATGGNSYIYFDVVGSVMGPIEIDIPNGLKKGALIINTVPHFVGIYPLHNVYLSQFGPYGWVPSIDYGTVFPKELGRPRQSPEIGFYQETPKHLVFFFISTSNGSYSEVILLKKFGEKWLWAFRFSKYGQKKPLVETPGPGFPKDLVDADWDKL